MKELRFLVANQKGPVNADRRQHYLRFELGRIPFPLCHIHGLLRLIDRILLGGSKVGDHLSIQRVKGRAMQGGRSRRQTFAFPYRDSLGRPPFVSRHNPVHELIE